MIVIIPPDGNKLFGTILVIVGLVTYKILDWVVWIDDPPTAFTVTFFVPAANPGVVADIIVSVKDVIAAGDDPIVRLKGFWAVL